MTDDHVATPGRRVIATAMADAATAWLGLLDGEHRAGALGEQRQPRPLQAVVTLPSDEHPALEAVIRTVAPSWLRRAAPFEPPGAGWER